MKKIALLLTLILSVTQINSMQRSAQALRTLRQVGPQVSQRFTYARPAMVRYAGTATEGAAEQAQRASRFQTAKQSLPLAGALGIGAYLGMPDQNNAAAQSQVITVQMPEEQIVHKQIPVQKQDEAQMTDQTADQLAIQGTDIILPPQLKAEVDKLATNSLSFMGWFWRLVSKIPLVNLSYRTTQTLVNALDHEITLSEQERSLIDRSYIELQQQLSTALFAHQISQAQHTAILEQVEQLLSGLTEAKNALEDAKSSARFKGTIKTKRIEQLAAADSKFVDASTELYRILTQMPLPQDIQDSINGLLTGIDRLAIEKRVEQYANLQALEETLRAEQIQLKPSRLPFLPGGIVLRDAWPTQRTYEQASREGLQQILHLQDYTQALGKQIEDLNSQIQVLEGSDAKPATIRDLVQKLEDKKARIEAERQKARIALQSQEDLIEQTAPAPMPTVPPQRVVPRRGFFLGPRPLPAHQPVEPGD